ncbi:MAG: restriction endonuclease subunit S [Terriglobia bacterium]|jgi:type I restriction enzyme S subunit
MPEDVNNRQSPEGWHWVRLGEACRVVGGSTPSSGVTEFWDGDIVWITPTDLGKLKGHLITDSSRRITESGYESCGTELVPVGSVVLSSRAPIGHLGIAGVPLCTNQGCKTFVPGANVDSQFLFFSLRQAVPTLQSLGSGATFAEISKSELEGFEIALPPPSEQKRIAAILNEQMEAVKRARAGAEAQLEAAKALPAAYLRAVFSSPKLQQWPMKTLGEISKLLPSKSIATNGDAEVLAITTACLSEGGFLASGVKVARMWAVDVAECTVARGEVLVARSNTPELVGRVAMFPGEPRGAVASDLTIRIWPANDVSSEFLTAYLSFLYQTGHWRERAGGASGSMKKITRDQIQAEQVPVPPIAGQERIAAMLNEQMASAERVRNAIEEELDAINKLPAALLRRAFNGEL